jgi:hypothetical protein
LATRVSPPPARPPQGPDSVDGDPGGEGKERRRDQPQRQPFAVFGDAVADLPDQHAALDTSTNESRPKPISVVEDAAAPAAMATRPSGKLQRAVA